MPKNYEKKEYEILGEYVKENLYSDIPGTGNVFTAGDQTWNQEKIRAYFCECFAQINVFNEKSEDFAKALMSFVNDENHTGEEADASKSFINDNLYAITVDTVRSVQILMGKMQGLSFESSVPLLEDFCEDLSEDDTAILNKSKLEKVIIDFAAYNRDFQDNTPTIKSYRDDAQAIVESCDVISIKTLDDPDPSAAQAGLDDFVKNGKEGFVPTLMEKFLAFLDEHNDDFSGTEFVSLIDHINENLKRIQDGLGDGSFDPETYAENLSNIVYEKAGDSEAYQAYIDTYLKFVKGMATRCQVYCYDPVNMNTGNFISNRTDLKIGGRHGIEVRRFYNAQSDVVGVLGRGWTLNFELHLAKTDDETITVFYDDGKEGCFKKTNIGKEEVYLEIHGEEGTLKETDNIYRLSYDDNKYIDFDSDGYVTTYGDNYGPNTTIEYDLFEKEIDGKVERKALPVRVKTQEGNELIFSYNELGLLISVKDHTGREVSYKYEDAKDKYRLTSILSPNGATRQFHYTEDGLIKEMVRPDGIVGVVNEYDSKKRIIHQTMPDGGEIKFSYDEDRHVTTAIEQNGCKVEYISDEIGRHIGTRYPEQDIEEKYTYNDRGLKTSHTDRRGYTTRYTYDNRGHLTGIIGPEGLHEFYTYDADGKLSSKKDSNGNVTKFKYDLEGNLFSVIDPMGGKIRYYYQDGKITSIKDPENNITKLTYDDRGNVASITDSNGVVTKYETDSLGRVIASEDTEGNKTTYDIDVNDNITRVVDPEGNVTSYEYTALGKVSAITNPDGTKKTWEYNAIGKPSTFTDEEGRSTKIYYNLLGKEERIILPNSGEINYEYDLLGNRIKVSDPDGRLTTFNYDKAGNILSVLKGEEKQADEGVAVACFSYDGRGRKKSEIDGNGNKITYEYDDNGNITKIIAPNGGVTKRTYDKANRIINEIDAIGRETVYTYDKNGKIASTTDPYGVVKEHIYENNRLCKILKKAGGITRVINSFEYDCCGRLSAQIREDGYRVSYTYSKSGRLVDILGSDGRKKTIKYDSCGRVIEICEANFITKYTYTPTGKLSSVTDALGNRTEYSYNELDLLKKVERINKEDIDNSHVTIYEHSLAGSILSITDALGQKDSYTYDRCGNIKSHIDRDNNESIYTRDQNGNIVGVHYADGRNVRMRYNALNILQEVEDYLGITKIESDILGRIISVKDYKGRVIGYEYDRGNNRKAISYPDGKRAEYTYDAFGRLESLTDGTSDKPITYTYDAIGRLSGKSFPNGVKTALEYYQGGLLKSMTSTDTQGIIDKYVYNYEKETSLVTGIERTRRGMDAVSGAYHYEYDALGRLTKSTLNGDLRAEYKYDAFGNRIEMTETDVKTFYEYDALDRLTKSIVRDSSNNVTSNSYSYDKRGNQVAIASDDIIKKVFKYDSRGKMICASDAEKGEITYAYNGLGFRVESTCAEEKIEYLCDISKDCYNLLERTVNGEKERFVYDDNVVSMCKDGNNYYYLHDELGSTMYLTGTDGLTVDAYAYDDFGRRVDPFTGKLRNRLGNNNKSHAYTKNGNIIQPFAFTGYQEDEVSELYFAQARYYDSQVGRFNGEDLLKGHKRKPDSFNHYSYCFNSPYNNIDINGCEPEKPTAYVYYIDDFSEQAKWQGEQLEEQGYDVTYVDLNAAASFTGDYFNLGEEWDETGVARTFVDVWNNGMPDDVDTVYIFAHGSERMIQFVDGSHYNALTVDGLNKSGEETAGSISDLETKSGVKNLYIVACNCGHYDVYLDEDEVNVAQMMSTIVPNASTYAWDGSVSFNHFLGRTPRLSWLQEHFNKDLNNGVKYPKRKPLGQLEYKNGELVTEVDVYCD